jgi:hypothetical protein
MKHVITFIFLIVVVTINSCIGEDIINDEIAPEVRILNPIQSIAVSETHQYNARYFNNIGEEEETTISWSVLDQSIATITPNGLITGITTGETTVNAFVTSSNGTVIEDSVVITITMDTVEQELIVKTGTIATTSSYTLTGDFTIEEIENSDALLLSIQNNYQASTNLPGLYLYLTNNPNSINGALSLGPVTVFNGAHTYDIDTIGINDYTYLLYWCEPFGVKVGVGTIND